MTNRIGVTNQYSSVSLANSDHAKQAANRIKILYKNANQDHVVFSTTGKKLNLIINDKDNLSGTNGWNTVLSGSQNQNLNTADEYIARAGTLLEQMLEITEAAKDNSLSIDERLALQVELGRLQHELNIIGETLGVAPGFGDLNFKNGQENVIKNQVLGSYENSRNYRMLKRAADRVAEGGQWDVREIAHRGPWKKNADGVASDINGVVNGVQEDYFGSSSISTSLTKQRLGTDDLSGYVGRIYEVVDDASVPTVGDILKSTGRSIMDTASAEETAEKLKQELAKLKELQTQLVEVAQGGNEQSNLMGSALEQDPAKFLQQVAKLLKTFNRDSDKETIGREAAYMTHVVHDGRDGPLFSPSSEGDESPFKNKNLSNFKPSAIADRR